MKKKSTPDNPLQFDVIIIYDGRIAFSAGNLHYRGRTPFSKSSKYVNYNRSYEYFLTHCAKQGLRAAFATTKDISGSGLLKAVWVYNKTWKRVIHPAESFLIFDKFSGLTAYNIKQLALLTKSGRKVRLFHSQKIRKIFDDKLKTFTTFSNYAIPTVKIDVVSEKHIIAAKKKLYTQLQHHKYVDDFTDDRVLKDQFGSGGKNVYKVHENKKIRSIGKQIPLIYFVLQPLIDASNFEHDSAAINTDLRVIICDGKIVQCYVRTAKQGDFRANASQGGHVEYIRPSKIPKDVLRMSHAISKKLSVPHAFYALDFIKSSTGHLYFVEGNITPGINWFDDEDERYAKQLMRLIIKNLKKMVVS